MIESTIMASLVGTLGSQVTASVKDGPAKGAGALATDVGTTLISTATSAIGVSINNNGIQEIQHKYANAYVESMSDEELEMALMKMDLLEAEQEEKSIEKSI